MFRKKAITIAVGDQFEESLTGSKKLFAALNMQASDAATFKTVWVVSELVKFNGLEHARLVADGTSESRLISLSLLREEKHYKKKLGS